LFSLNENKTKQNFLKKKTRGEEKYWEGLPVEEKILKILKLLMVKNYKNLKN